MANPEHVELVIRGADAIREWREKNPNVRLDLKQAHLRKVNLAGADLREAQLESADLAAAYLHGAKFSSANLRNSILRGATFQWHLNGSQRTASLLFHYNPFDAATQFDGADLTGADLSWTDLSWVTLNDAKLVSADLWKTILFRARLRGADLRQANLQWVDFQYADINNADFSRADLSGAKVIGATTDSTMFSQTIFGGTSIDNVDLSRAIGLELSIHREPSHISWSTLAMSKGKIPESFLRGCGIPEKLITFLPSLTGNAIEFYSCFISYSHNDKSFARRLHDALQGRGIRCWLDEHQLRPGDDIHEQVDRGIRLWDKTLLCASQNSLTSWWVDNEIETAFAKERQIMKERQKKVLALVPLELDGYLFESWDNGKADQVKSRVAADFKGWDTDNSIFERELEKLVKTLRADDGGREPPPPPRL